MRPTSVEDALVLLVLSLRIAFVIVKSVLVRVCVCVRCAVPLERLYLYNTRFSVRFLLLSLADDRLASLDARHSASKTDVSSPL